jgi:hypothetical protein
MRVGGIDTGKKGAGVWLDTETRGAGEYRLKFDKLGDLDLKPYVSWLSSSRLDLVVVETPIVNKGGASSWGVAQIFNMGDALGQVKLATRLAGIPIRYIKPRQWQSKILEGIPAKLAPKDRALLAYKQLYPGEPISIGKAKRPHDGVVDALLIATYGVLEYAGGRLEQWDFLESTQ